MPCGCTKPPVAGRKIGTAPRALAASAGGTWNVRLPDGTLHPDGPFRSLIKAQGIARRTAGSRVV